MRVKDLLTIQHQTVPSLTDRQSVADAIDMMRTAGAGAVVVTSDHRSVGIFTRSDVMRASLDSPGKSFSDIALKEAMTAKLITASPGDDVAATIAVMLRAHIGKMPVLEDGKIIAVLSIQELVTTHIDALDNELDNLHDYIDRLHESYHD